MHRYILPNVVWFVKLFLGVGNYIIPKAFHDYVFKTCDAILFLRGRVRFCLPTGKETGSASAPSVLIAWGQFNVEKLRQAASTGLPGSLWIPS